MESISIFISSPGDVDEERRLTGRVIERFQYEFGQQVELDAVFWEHEPLRATASFQEQIPRPSTMDIVVFILWSRLGTRLPSHITRPDGTMYASGTEFEFEDAWQACHETGCPEILVYRKDAQAIASLDSEEEVLRRLDQKRALDGFIQKWFIGDDGSLKGAFHHFNTPADFEDLLEKHLRSMIERRLRSAESEDDTDSLHAAWRRGSPFRGLEAFDVEHAPIFCGRTSATSEVLQALRNGESVGTPFVLVVGPSGSGKSSLLRAGVLPTLTQSGVMDGIGVWRYGVVRPSDNADLFLGLAECLLADSALPEIAAAGVHAEELAKVMRASPEGAVVTVKTALARVSQAVQQAEKLPDPPEARLALMLDQLEELFTLEGITLEQRNSWMGLISALVHSGFVWVLATLRSDFYEQAMQLPHLVELKRGAGQYDLRPPGAHEIGRIIRQPARMAGLRFEHDPKSGESLDAVLLNSALENPDALPLLEFTLEELYIAKTDAGLLSFAAYEAMGGMEGALASRAEAVFLGLPKEAQRELPAVLNALISVGLDSERRSMRRHARLDVLRAISNRAVLVDALIEARLIIADVDTTGQAVVSVTHEAILRRWPRVVEWIEANHGALRSRARISAAAAIWEEKGRAPSYLLPPGEAQRDASRLLDDLSFHLDDREEAFVTESLRREKKRRLKVAGFLIAVVGVFSVVSVYGYWARYVRMSDEELIRREEVSLFAESMLALESTVITEPHSRRLRVSTLNDEDMSAFKILEGKRIWDLREWKPFTRGEGRKYYSPATLITQNRVQKIAPAPTYQWQGRTSGTDIYWRCTSHPPDSYRVLYTDAPSMTGGRRLLPRQLVLDVMDVPVGDQFNFESRATFWDGQPVDEKQWLGDSAEKGQIRLTIIILFPEDRPWKTYKLAVYTSNGPEVSGDVGDKLIVEDPERRFIALDFINPLPEHTYVMEWTW